MLTLPFIQISEIYYLSKARIKNFTITLRLCKSGEIVGVRCYSGKNCWIVTIVGENWQWPVKCTRIWYRVIKNNNDVLNFWKPLISPLNADRMELRRTLERHDEHLQGPRIWHPETRGDPCMNFGSRAINSEHLCWPKLISTSWHDRLLLLYLQCATREVSNVAKV